MKLIGTAEYNDFLFYVYISDSREELHIEGANNDISFTYFNAKNYGWYKLLDRVYREIIINLPKDSQLETTFKLKNVWKFMKVKLASLSTKNYVSYEESVKNNYFYIKVNISHLIN